MLSRNSTRLRGQGRSPNCALGAIPVVAEIPTHCIMPSFLPFQKTVLTSPTADKAHFIGFGASPRPVPLHHPCKVTLFPSPTYSRRPPCLYAPKVQTSRGEARAAAFRGRYARPASGSGCAPASQAHPGFASFTASTQPLQLNTAFLLLLTLTALPASPQQKRGPAR